MKLCFEIKQMLFYSEGYKNAPLKEMIQFKILFFSSVALKNDKSVFLFRVKRFNWYECAVKEMTCNDLKMAVNWEMK